MKQKFLQVTTAMLLIITLTMANFILLCVDAVSYAQDIINMESSTNHKNVEFMAYFKDQKGNKTTALDAKSNSEDLKLYVQVSVKKEGYFNGNIILNNANFKLKPNMLNDGINSIENNVVYLNQINAGENKEIEIAIELLKDEKYDLNYLSMDSIVDVEGIYRDSTQKDISVKAERKVTLSITNPYEDSEKAVILTQNVITNKILKINEQEKRIVQIEINSGLNNNLYPVSNIVLNIQTPKISDKYPESVLVNSNKSLVTTGNTLSEENWKYNSETGKIEINLENKQEDGKVSWIKNGTDDFVITYIYDKDVTIENQKNEISSQVTLLDKATTVYTSKNEAIVSNEEKNSIVTSNIDQNEKEIYKGKLYAGISRNITYKNYIDVNLNNVDIEVDIKESEQTINGEQIISNYKTSKISKTQIEKVLGNNGKLVIVDANANKEITVINKNTNSDENGNINITYPENVQKILVKILNPENIGRIEIETTREIGKVNKEKAKEAKVISVNTVVSYISGNEKTELTKNESNINLMETETSADLQINRTELSAMTTNNNVEFRITLKSKEEKNELFKNPVINLELPEKIKNIEVNSINLLYENELKIASAKLIGNTIQITMQGEQTKYKEEAIDGATIIINANLSTDNRVVSSTEQVKLTYSNANAVNYSEGANIGTVSKNVNIVSYAGVITTNQISEYGIDLVNNEGTENGELPVATETKNVNITKKIINNKENRISNVKVLGVFPTKEAIDSNSIDIEVGNIEITGIDQNRVKIYYSDNANATEDLDNNDNNWSETITDNRNVKKYLVVINNMELLEEVDLTYSITIPANLEYNESAEEGYTVYYTNLTSEEKVDVNKIRLATPRGAVVDTTLKTLVAGNESNEVKENETLRYSIIVANTGSEDISNVIVTAKVPEGTTYVNSDKINDEINLDDLQFEDENKKEIEFDIEGLAKGQTITKYYEVKIQDGMAGKDIQNVVTTKYGDVSKISNEVKTSVKEGKLELKLVSVDATNGVVESGYSYRYILYATNKSDKDMKNVEITYNTNNDSKMSKIFYINDEDESKFVENTDDITVEKIKAGETVMIVGYSLISSLEPGVSTKVTSISAKAKINNIEYNSNEINNNAESSVSLKMTATSDNSGNYVESGDILKYNIVVKNIGTKTADSIIIKNWLANEVTLSKVLKDGTEISSENYSVRSDSNKNKKVLKFSNLVLEPGNSVEYQIEAVVNLLYGNKKAIEITDEISLEEYNKEISNAKIQHILQPDKSFVNAEDDKNNGGTDAGNKDNNENNGNNGNSGNIEGNNKYKIISGTAWVDKDENGQKDSGEQLVEGIKVRLLNVSTNEFVKDFDGNELSTTTSSTGFYSFEKVPNGKYIVVFEYDSTKYGLTKFEKEGISNEMNSNVISKDMNISGTNKKVAVTEILSVSDSNFANVNIGLIAAKNYDLQLDKYISKVTVQNNKTVTNNYTDSKLVKTEIDAKQVNSTTIVVEYTIRVTNKGDVTAYVRKIADYLSNDYKFSSELNKDWYQSGNDVYCTSLTNEKLEPGQSKEVTLTVIKQMKENNTGLINNTAEIVDSYNELGLTDSNSTEGNKVKGENDMSSADLIISIRTGQVVTTVLLIISTIVMIGIAGIFIKKYAFGRMI